MNENQIFIARDKKSGMHVLIRVLPSSELGQPYPPIDSSAFNRLLMAVDVKSLVLAARDLGPMYISEGDLEGRIFLPSQLQQEAEQGIELVPPDLGSLLSECFFDPYAIPTDADGLGYKKIGRTAKKPAKELIDEFDFTEAGDLSYLDSQFRAVIEPLHDWIFARNLLSILMRIGGLYRAGADPDTILEKARFRRVDTNGLKDRFLLGTDTCYAIPIAFNPFYRVEDVIAKAITFDADKICPLYSSLIDDKESFNRAVIEQPLKGRGNEFVKFLTSHEAPLTGDRFDYHEAHPDENKWWYMVISSETNGIPTDDQMQLANRLLQAFDGRLFQPRIVYTGIKMTEMSPEQKPRNMLEAMWLLVRKHPNRYLLTCKRCMRTVLSGTQGGERSFCSNSCRATWSKEHPPK